MNSKLGKKKKKNYHKKQFAGRELKTAIKQKYNTTPETEVLLRYV